MRIIHCQFHPHVAQFSKCCLCSFGIVDRALEKWNLTVFSRVFDGKGVFVGVVFVCICIYNIIAERVCAENAIHANA